LPTKPDNSKLFINLFFDVKREIDEGRADFVASAASDEAPQPISLTYSLAQIWLTFFFYRYWFRGVGVKN
jgi:hypothetical protein